MAESVDLLERDEELVSLADAIADYPRRPGRLIVIDGEAGIGKTRLLGAARDLAADAGFRVLRARGSALERSFAYGVVRQLFEPVLAKLGREKARDLMSGPAALAQPVFEAAPWHSPAAASGEAIFAVLHGLYWLAANLAERDPVLIAVDDLHWSDTPSTQWLAYLGRRLEGLPIMVAVALRPSEPGMDRVAIGELVSDPLSTTLRPRPLTQEATNRLIETVMRQRPAPAFGMACHQASGGNPLLLTELLDALARDGVTPSATEVSLVRGIGPAAVSRSVETRLSHLGRQARELARALAVLGDGTDLSTVGTLAGLDPVSASDAADTLAAAGILVSDLTLGFVHPLVREAVYTQMAAGERNRAHERAAAILAERDEAPERTAAHLLHAPLGTNVDASKILRAAAEQALARSAPTNAATYLRRSLEESKFPPERAELQYQLGRIEALVGDPDAERHLRQALESPLDPPVRAKLQLTLARCLFWAKRAGEAIEVLEGATAEAPDEPAGLRERLEAELVGIALSDPRSHEAGARRLSKTSESVPDTVGGKMLLAFAAYLDAYRGTEREQCIERANQALADDDLLAEETSMSWLAGLLSLLYADRLDLAQRAAERMRSTAREHGTPTAFALGSAALSRVLADRGLLFEAEADAKIGLDACPEGQPIISAYIGSALAHALLKRGELDGAGAALERGGLSHTGTLMSIHTALPLGIRARLHLVKHEAAAALADFLQICDLLESIGSHNPAASRSARSMAALAHLELGDRDEAHRLAREELVAARAWGAPSYIGVAQRVLGLIEGGTQGLALLQQSVDMLEPTDAGYELLHSRVDLGAALRRANRRAAARDLLRQCLDQAQRTGAGLLAAHAHAELLATGARPRQLVMTGVESLTGSERRVAGMAAEGMTNREIAQALFVSIKTVEMHLGQVFSKLGIQSRTQLPPTLSSSPRPVDAWAEGGMARDK